MMKRKINFYIGALLITVVGAGASFAIMQTADSADAHTYGSAHIQQQRGEVPTVTEQLQDLGDSAQAAE